MAAIMSALDKSGLVCAAIQPITCHSAGSLRKAYDVKHAIKCIPYHVYGLFNVYPSDVDATIPANLASV